MYTTPAPLARNSTDGLNACETARARQIVSDMEKLVTDAYRASQMIAGPNSFRSMGAAVVVDVARSQNALATAQSMTLPAKADPKSEDRAAPTWLPLNVSLDEYNSCCQNPGVALAPMAVPAPKDTFPPFMPPRAVLPVSAPAPSLDNLCWALRNGAVDASQFEGDSLLKLQYACTQKGYTGACMPPPAVALYLDQGRRAGTLPKIRVNQSVIDSIPRAPELTGRDCSESYRLAGMGMVWGDAAASRCAPAAMQIQSGPNYKTLGLLALAALGIYAVSK